MSANGNHRSWTGFHDKTLWHWLELLVIPGVLTCGLLWFDLAENERARVSESQRAQTQLYVEDQQAKESALQMYLDRMSVLLLEKRLRNSSRNDDVRNLARARTLTVLSRLDGKRKGFLLRFLYESGLISTTKPIITLGGSILGETTTDEIVLSKADLSGAELNRVFLLDSYLTRVHLIGANLQGSQLTGSNLSGADLRNANLSGASLKKANLSNADLRGAQLTGVDFSGAKLRNAKVTADQLASAATLTGAIMPDGSLHD